MAIDRPAVAIYTSFNQDQSTSLQPVRATIVGPNAILHRYAESSEKAGIRLGAYDPISPTTYTWPGRSAGGVVDLDYVKVYLDNAKLLYFTDSIGSDSTIAPVSGKVNRIRSTSLGFASNGASYLRSAGFYDRDVTVGDLVYIRGVVSGDSHELNTYVKGLAYETVAAIVGTATRDTGNAAAQSSSGSVTQLDDLQNCITLAADISAYDGLADGDITETYTVEVIQSSVDGDLTTALLRVRTASGRDDEDNVVPAALDSPTEIGARGLEITFELSSGSCSSIASENSVTYNDLIVGQKWSILVNQVFERPNATAAGTYSGTVDDTYIVEVTRGGLFSGADAPQITVTTAKGLDESGPTDVENDNEAVSIGTKGVTILFYGSGGGGSDPVDGLRKGDKYVVPVTAAANGRASTLILGHRMSDELLTATDLELKLYIKKPSIELPQDRISAPPATNWDTEATQITINDGAELYDSTWTDDGEELPLPVVEGTLYVEYREWAQALCGEVGEYDIDTYDTIPGQTHPDNPFKYGVFLAAGAARGETVLGAPVCSPSSTDSWEDAIDNLVGVPEAYGLVPQTDDAAIRALFAAHVSAQSGPTSGLERVQWLSSVSTPTIQLIGETANDEVVLATLTDNIDASGTQYTLLSITTSDVSLIDAGVRAGDTVRFLYTTNGFDTTYTEFVVDTVEGEDTLVLTTGHTGAVNTPQKVEIWRERTPNEFAAAVAAEATAISDRRTRLVYFDNVAIAGYPETPGHVMCAYLAGIRSGIEPNRSMTNYPLSGFTVVNTGVPLSMTQIDILRNAGVWVVTKNRAGQIFTHLGLTTDLTGINQREEMIVTTLDVVNKYLRAQLEPYIGQANAVPSALDRIRVDLRGALEFLKSPTADPLLGNVIVDYVIVDISRHATAKDRVVITLNLTLPAPINNIDVYQLII